VHTASIGLSPQRDPSSKQLNGEHRRAVERSSITQRLLSTKFFPGTRRRFLLRLAGESPHLGKIKSAWTGIVAGLGLAPEVERALVDLDVAKLHGHLRSGDFNSYESALEQLGQDLGGYGVPEECAAAALGLFFEICLCGLLVNAREDKEYVLGLTRLASASRLFLAAGYASHRTEEIGGLLRKLQKAEERAEALATTISEANEKERRRLASDLHDEIGHDLVVLKLYIEMIIADANESMDSEVRKRLTEASSLATRAIEAVRRLAFDLGPGIFAESGFIPAIRSYARRFSSTTGVRATVRVVSPYKVLQSREELALYRVLQGALSNVLKHSRAKAVVIMTSSDANFVRMTIEDDGRGFNVARKLRHVHAIFGLQAMRERIELLGGCFQIHSPVAQAGRRRYGTRIEIVLPVARAEAK
jgi:signal transduction histidine kinase